MSTWIVYCLCAGSFVLGMIFVIYAVYAAALTMGAGRD